MKARVKATGEIVDVDFDKDALANDYPPYCTNEIPSRFFLAEQLEWINIKEKVDPDYWTRLEHQYAGMFLKSFLDKYDGSVGIEDIINSAIKVAHALVEKLKEKEE